MAYFVVIDRRKHASECSSLCLSYYLLLFSALLMIFQVSFCTRHLVLAVMACLQVTFSSDYRTPEAAGDVQQAIPNLLFRKPVRYIAMPTPNPCTRYSNSSSQVRATYVCSLYVGSISPYSDAFIALHVPRRNPGSLLLSFGAYTTYRWSFYRSPERRRHCAYVHRCAMTNIEDATREWHICSRVLREASNHALERYKWVSQNEIRVHISCNPLRGHRYPKLLVALCALRMSRTRPAIRPRRS